MVNMRDRMARARRMEQAGDADDGIGEDVYRKVQMLFCCYCHKYFIFPIV